MIDFFCPTSLTFTFSINAIFGLHLGRAMLGATP